MFTVIKNGKVLHNGVIEHHEILIAGEKILAIQPVINPCEWMSPVAEIDAGGQFVLPGMIDQHVHLIGGGGESGFSTRTPEVQISKLVQAGITTVLGLLGTDSVCRHLESLYAKVKGLEEEGITAYMVTGAYQVPSPTITGSVYQDVVFIDKVLGCKTAIADHRSSHPTVSELTRMASEVRVGAMLANKAGLIVVHMGNSSKALTLIDDVLKQSDIPIKHFLPTHVNRQQHLFHQAIQFALKGGAIDLTSGIDPDLGAAGAVKPSLGILQALDAGVSLNQMTLSSDGNGSIPVFNQAGNMIGMGVAGFESLLGSIQDLVSAGLALEKAWTLVSSNVATRLHLTETGELKPGYQADLVFLDDHDLSLTLTMAKGSVMYKRGAYCKQGMFE
ncbi:beta-aspartyl-peptidase [Photobacterium sp. GJ3]|uniref:beta-aspartyl-peptidase n=1 Tax=Photobacterium sp. GJ3 TaxID=2829502 RepID=UPI001B8B8CE7|nr:beta-aspartyl-peptidase [Photobacterium sp. GJ3]QUJ67967.1 beta-aspartyl-peptidase [Photobacterium sp. GJ3]